MKRLTTRLFFLCGLLLAGGARAEVINVYTSANFAPLIREDGSGLYPDMVARLNRARPGNLSFELHFLPRKRLQVKLEEGTLDGIVIGLMPAWLNDAAQKKYLWTAPFATDRFALVSLASRDLRPDEPGALSGASVGVTLGYVYPGLDEWFQKSQAQRTGGLSDEKNLEKLLLGRVDGVVVSQAVTRHFIRTRKLGNSLRIHPLPGMPMERRFLAQHRDARVYQALAPVIAKLRDDPSWQSAAAGYE